MRDFFVDATKTFMYFALSPLQWLFWRFPKAYEAVIIIIAFVKNNIPTKNETLHTVYYWYSCILSGLTVINFSLIKLLICINKQFIHSNDTALDKIKDLR